MTGICFLTVKKIMKTANCSCCQGVQFYVFMGASNIDIWNRCNLGSQAVARKLDLQLQSKGRNYGWGEERGGGGGEFYNYCENSNSIEHLRSAVSAGCQNTSDTAQKMKFSIKDFFILCTVWWNWIKTNASNAIWKGYRFADWTSTKKNSTRIKS